MCTLIPDACPHAFNRDPGRRKGTVHIIATKIDFEAILGNLDVDAIVQATRNNHVVQNPSPTNFVPPPEPNTRPIFTAPHPSVSDLIASPEPPTIPPSQYTSSPRDQPSSHPSQPQSSFNRAAAPAKPVLSALGQQTIDDLFD
ncbi:hypothetical protein BWQ96_10167 [Gracilariopsis chorda]|uniref:Uncharacterized protein n=1 Tax=Gracilariopsis chorda TaxID=448386 RepID=A0A2V3IDG6_9FLOR|nr:hypothetical protein BWQ96_10167 [Gracilariopsis chorda]|eukprot:PXF40129.1 hypothetical protein BWQ96_10167 [Gracilariopsis chorda]